MAGCGFEIVIAFSHSLGDFEGLLGSPLETSTLDSSKFISNRSTATTKISGVTETLH